LLTQAEREKEGMVMPEGVRVLTLDRIRKKVEKKKKK